MVGAACERGRSCFAAGVSLVTSGGGPAAVARSVPFCPWFHARASSTVRKDPVEDGRSGLVWLAFVVLLLFVALFRIVSHLIRVGDVLFCSFVGAKRHWNSDDQGLKKKTPQDDDA